MTPSPLTNRKGTVRLVVCNDNQKPKSDTTSRPEICTLNKKVVQSDTTKRNISVFAACKGQWSLGHSSTNNKGFIQISKNEQALACIYFL